MLINIIVYQTLLIIFVAYVSSTLTRAYIGTTSLKQSGSTHIKCRECNNYHTPEYMHLIDECYDCYTDNLLASNPDDGSWEGR